MKYFVNTKQLCYIEVFIIGILFLKKDKFKVVLVCFVCLPLKICYMLRFSQGTFLPLQSTNYLRLLPEFLSWSSMFWPFHLFSRMQTHKNYYKLYIFLKILDSRFIVHCTHAWLVYQSISFPHSKSWKSADDQKFLLFNWKSKKTHSYL